MNYRSISDLNELIMRKLAILPHDFDLIVAIPRSGLFAATLIAEFLNRQVTDLSSFTNGHIYGTGNRGQYISVTEYKKVLVVDDTISSGDTMLQCKAFLKQWEAAFDIKYAAVYVAPGKEKLVDYYFEVLPLPRLFQWNVFNHQILLKTCMDIDGVICVDPTHEQNDDGPKYEDFVRNAQPLFIPGAPVGTLITSRLEKYRNLTEEWLRKHNVHYERLVMMNLPDKEARARANCHAAHKAAEYKSSYYNLFVESSPQQAIEINEITGKPVLCTRNFKMVYDKMSFAYQVKSGEKLPIIRRSLLYIRDFKKHLLH